MPVIEELPANNERFNADEEENEEEEYVENEQDEEEDEEIARVVNQETEEPDEAVQQPDRELTELSVRKSYTYFRNTSIVSPINLRESSIDYDATRKSSDIYGKSSRKSSNYIGRSSQKIAFVYDKSSFIKSSEEEKENWCFRSECSGYPNIFWLIIGILIIVFILIIFLFTVLSFVYQQDANLNTVTGQSGKFVGQSCTNSKDCTSGAICASKICQCATDSYYDVYLGKCLPLKTYGVSCMENRECNAYINLVCSNSACTCNPQAVWANYYGRYECVRLREIGETCQDSTHCTINSNCTSIYGTYRCSCPSSNMFLSGVTGKCEFMRKVNERCYGWYQECPPLTTCRTNNNGDSTLFCQCIDLYYYNVTSQTCVSESSFNGTCSSSIPCISEFGLFCLNNICVCSTTSYWNGTYCQPYSGYGRPCSSNQQCLQTDTNVTCAIPPNGISQMMCICKTGYYYDEYLQSCRIQKPQGSYCAQSNECVDNATCVALRCSCLPGYWSNPSTLQCEPYLSYGEVCTTFGKPCNQLINNTDCYSNICQCDPTYQYWDGQYCQNRRWNGDTCSTTILCYTYRGLGCVSGTCQCSSPKTWSSTYWWCV